MSCDVRQHFLGDSIDLQLYGQRKYDPVFNTLIGLELPVLNGVVEQEFERRDEPDILQN